MTFTTRRIHEERPPSRWAVAAKKSAPLFLKFGTLLVALYGKWKVRREHEEQKEQRVQLLKKLLVILLSVLAGLLILAGTVRALVALRILTVHNFLSVAGSQLPADESGFTNVLLLGAGDKDHDGVDLTDAIMVVSLDPWKTRSAVMLSLPRDLYVLKSETMGRGRINELYRNRKYQLRHEGTADPEASLQSMRELGEEVGRHMGITVHRVVKVDFTAFTEVVDALGGVDIEVPEDIVDPEYPGPNYTYEPFAIRKGPRHLDGETALKYARSRHTTSDFGRSARQQQLLQALAEKARSEGIASSPGKISSLLKILADHVETTMTFGEILGALRLGESIDHANVISHTLNIETGIDSPFATPGGFLYAPPRDQFEGASVLLPYSIPEFPVTWKQIQAFTRFLLQHRALLLQKPQIMILNAGAKSGAARLLGNELIRYGIENVETDNAFDDRRNPPKLAASVVVAQSGHEDTAAFMADFLKIPASPLPPGIAPEKQGPVTIVLGTDYTYTPLQDLIPSAE